SLFQATGCDQKFFLCAAHKLGCLSGTGKSNIQSVCYYFLLIFNGDFCHFEAFNKKFKRCEAGFCYRRQCLFSFDCPWFYLPCNFLASSSWGVSWTSYLWSWRCSI